MTSSGVSKYEIQFTRHVCLREIWKSFLTFISHSKMKKYSSHFSSLIQSDIPVCRKSMDSVDIIHGHCPAGVLERRSMDNVH